MRLIRVESGSSHGQGSFEARCCLSRVPYVVMDVARGERTVDAVAAYAAGILESVPDAIVGFDRHLRVVYANRQAVDLLGKDLDELVQRSVREVFPTGMGVTLEREAARALAEGATIEYEDFCPPLARWFAVRLFPMDQGVSALFQDVTERRDLLAREQAARTRAEAEHERAARFAEERDRARAEAEAQRSHLYDLFMKVPARIAVGRGPDHRYEFANERYLEFLDDKDIIGKPAREVFPEADKQGIVEIADRVYITGEPFVGTEMPYLVDFDRDGVPEYRYFNVVFQPLRGAHDVVDGLMLLTVDVTEQVRARKQIEHLAAEREAILEQMAEAVVMVDRNGKITYLNEAACQMFGLSGDEDTLRTFMDHIEVMTLDGHTLDPEDRTLARALQGEATRNAWRRARRRDGTEVITQSNAVPLRAADGTRFGALATFRDATEQYALERQKDDFLSAAAHDLKTPLATIKGLAQVLHRRAERANTPETRAFLDSLHQIDTTTSRMAGLINDLLDVTRLHMSRPLDLSRRSVDLVQLVKHVVAEHQQTAERHHMMVRAAVPSLTGSWDPARIERLTSNLLSNAVKYSPAGGDIEIEMWPEGEGATRNAVLRVRDYGIGIPGTDIPHLFERFHRGANVSHTMPGTGIGLASVRQITEQHGGTVSVVSEEGQGATFIVRLPLA